ncbi:MAG TPA: hypothetical protein DEP35_05355, partial [Deltaproteobacteria bacterium]|nr:hypothetical protein [Deltaproteobacteria bacterium]
RTHDFGEVDGVYFITMEFVEGQSLKYLIQSRGSLPANVVLTVGKQLCRALEVAHEQGVIHRDIKPQNLIVEPSGTLKVMDFGIARVLGSVHLTQNEHRVGTPAFMAPEQIRGEEADVRSDVYSLGLLLYLLLTGKAPFSAKSDYELCRMHLEEAPPPPRTIVGDIPDAIDRAVLRALAKAPGERFSCVRELRGALSIGFVSTLTAPMGLGSVGSKKTVVLPEDETPAGSRETAKTLELADEQERSAPATGARSAEDEDTAQMESLPTLHSWVAAPGHGSRRGFAFAMGGAALAAVVALWAGHLLRPETPEPLAAPTEAAPSTPAEAPAASPAPPAPAEPTELASEARAEGPPPAPAAKRSRTHQRRQVKRAERRSPPAAPPTEALPAAPDEEHEDGWVIRRH